MPEYLIRVTEEDADRLEHWLGGQVRIVPAWYDSLSAGVPIAGLDAVLDGEAPDVRERLRTSGPRYHAGGPARPPQLTERELEVLAALRLASERLGSAVTISQAGAWCGGTVGGLARTVSSLARKGLAAGTAAPDRDGRWRYKVTDAGRDRLIRDAGQLPTALRAAGEIYRG